MYYVELFILGLIDGSMYALMAIGLTLIYGLLRVLHVAHAGVFVLGAFVGVFVTNATGSFVLGFLLAVPLGGVLGIAIYRFIYQPLLDKSPVVPLIASIGLFILMEDAYRLIFQSPHVSNIQYGGDIAQCRSDRNGRYFRPFPVRIRHLHQPHPDRCRLARNGF